VLGVNGNDVGGKLGGWGSGAVSGYTMSIPRWFLKSDRCSTSFWNSLKVVLSGGALRERVGLCRGRREVQVLGGGESRAESNRFLLGEAERIASGMSSSASSGSGSISVSRVTMTGRLTGRGLLRPKVKPDFMGGYRGIGDINTVRSVIVDNDVEEGREHEFNNVAIYIFKFYLFAYRGPSHGMPRVICT
jgi:hypothetical protein